MVETQKVIRTRRVFHIPGYDPIHPRRYRELYRKECAAQAAISGYDIGIRPAKSEESFRWLVDAETDGQVVSSQIDILVWSDIVRDSMAQSIPATYWQLLRTAWVYIASGALRRLMRLRKGPIIAALYPVFFLLGQFVIAVSAGWLVGRGVAGLVGENAGFVPFLLQWVVLGLVATVILRWF